MLVGSAFAQTTTIKGKVVDDSGESLIGANVIIEGTTEGTTTDIDGNFAFQTSLTGSKVVLISFIGYNDMRKEVTLNGGTVDLGTVKIIEAASTLNEVEVIASIAIDRKTPVAVSTIDAQVISEQVGNQEFVEILRSTPSIYVTKQGGGFGDSRINVRGFDQINTAVLINGIPVNDMENGRVFWSNWAGLTDVTSQIQVQRGLSASKLALSSVGGTINIITNAAEIKKGGSLTTSFGNDGFQKYGFMVSSGKDKNGFAITLQGTHTRGDGYVDGTKFEAWSYFASIAKVFNDKHSINFTALGAPQWHHQRTVGAFDGVTIQTYRDNGIKYNHLWGTYQGEEFNWRRNFYHKPKIFLNHYWNISDKTELATSAYASFGRGGGTGPRGRINGSFDTSSKFRDANGQVRWDDIDAWNRGLTVPDFGPNKQTWANSSQNPGVDNEDGFFADKYVNTSRDGFIRRASVNSHNWWGMLSTLNHEFNENWKLVAGFDARYYEGIHYRRLDNLLGADAYFTDTDINNAGVFLTQEKESNAVSYFLDDQKLNYHNVGFVRWLGLFGQLEYSNEQISAFVAVNGSQQGHKRQDFFNYFLGDDTEADGNPKHETDWENIIGGNVKAGINYNINDQHNVFFNTGYFSRVPFFDVTFNTFENDLNTDFQNEKIFGLELGYGFRHSIVNANVNLYRTSWTDRNLTRSFGNDEFGNLKGVSQVHTGVELEAFITPMEGLTFEVMTSIGDWTYANDVTVTKFDENQQITGESVIYLDGVKVGDAAQTTVRLGANYEIIKGLRVNASWYYADALYADYSLANDATFDTDGNQAVQIPSYSLVDAGVTYQFQLGGLDLSWRLNVNNVLDEIYIAELDTNFQGDGVDFNSNRGFFGFGRTWNTGLRIRF